jgi:hypothetical protein
VTDDGISRRRFLAVAGVAMLGAGSLARGFGGEGDLEA